MKGQKCIFMTGATGNMGSHTLKELLKRSDRFIVRALVLDTQKERRKIARFRKHQNLEVVYGDMRDAALIESCINDVDFVLHIGALVSPMADKHPKSCMDINYGSTINIINAIKKQKNNDQIALVYIGTVGETGCRMPPIHWGRCGDPIKPSIFDYYSVSKVASERAVIESGLKKWVSLRQTGMLPINKAGLRDPIVFHQNLNNVLEWVTAEESGKLMANVCKPTVPDSFWKKCYNIGGGEQWRFTNYELMIKTMEALGGDIRNCFDPRDFALFNFHGQWYTDSDRLNDILHFRCLDPNEYFQRKNRMIRILHAIPLLKLVLPSDKQLKKTYEKIKYPERGTGWMIENDKRDWIKAFFGSREKKNTIKSWEEGYQLIHPPKTPTYLNHGYDESIPTHDLSVKDMEEAALFRGGHCLSTDMKKGDLYTPLKWQCHKGHVFEATPYLILKAGHWCPVCESKAWDYSERAKHNPFFAQVWKPLHDEVENIFVKKDFK
ncbi:MAG: NAD-dependent epimerase/dehydratase family protein [Thermotogota bacterium]|nr:NAD-dependent epimerase/dehydratase family protein [Thermotogota bacterium]